MGARSAPALDFAGEVRAATRMPTFHAARIQDVATARHAIESGKLDMVGMTRAHLADPHIGRKIAEGREHAIRPCVGMGYCIDSIYAGQAVCIHNAVTGREATLAHVVPPSRGPLPPGRGDRGRSRRARSRAGGGRTWPCRHGLRGRRRSRRADPAHGRLEAPPRDPRDRRLAHGRMRAAWRGVPVQPLCRGRRRPGRKPRRGGGGDRRTSGYGLPRCRAGPRDHELGHPGRRGTSGGVGDPLRRQRGPPRHDDGRVHGRGGCRARGRDARADARARYRRLRAFRPMSRP